MGSSSGSIREFVVCPDAAACLSPPAERPSACAYTTGTSLSDGIRLINEMDRRGWARLGLATRPWFRLGVDSKPGGRYVPKPVSKKGF